MSQINKANTALLVPLWKTLIFVFLSVSAINAVELDTQEIELSEKYERIVKHSMLKYFRDGTFIVDSKVFLKEKLVPTKYRRVRHGNEIDKLPGLPVLPKEFKAEQSSGPDDTLRASQFDAHYDIKYIDVAILVDSSYSIDEFSFINDLIMMVANLDEMRGDRINISQKKFPSELLLDGHLQEEIDSGAFMPAVEPLDDTSKIINGIIAILPMIVISIVIFFFLVIVLWMLLRYYRSKNEMDNTERLTQAIKQITESTENGIGHTEDKVVETIATEHSSDDESPTLKSQRISILNSFIGRPEKATEVLSGWISKNAEEGYAHAATLVSVIDPKLLDVVKPFMQQQHVNGIEMQLQLIVESDDESKLEILSAFKEDYNKRIADAHEDRENYDIFNFLKQLTNEQLIHILKDEEDGIVGIALAQLSPKAAGEILQSFDGDKRSKLLISMGNISNIPVSLYKEVAEHLSKKALEVSNMRFVAADGIESIIDVISNLSVDGQDQYIKSIAEMDIELAQKIQRFYVTFKDLTTLPEDILSKVLQDVERDSLSAALVHVSEDFLVAVLNLFPERMQQMIRSGVDANDSITPESIDVARKEILHSVRAELKSLGGLTV